MDLNIPDISYLLVGGLFLTLIGITLGTTAKDARRRGKSPLLVCALILLSFPLGLAIWLIFRPEIVDGGGRQKPFRLEDHRLQ
jgi:hypothetical protein